MWEERYAAEDGFLFGQAPSKFLLDNPWVYAGKGSVLCVADGEGRNSVHLAKAGWDVTAFDLSPTAVDRARGLAAKAGVPLDAQASDWDAWDWSCQFDMVVAILVQFTGPEARAKQFADLARAVKPGGRLVLHGYRPEQIDYGTGGPPYRENMYTIEILKEHFSSWEIERLAAYDREQESGRMHVGMSALIDLIARKPATG